MAGYFRDWCGWTAPDLVNGEQQGWCVVLVVVVEDGVS